MTSADSTVSPCAGRSFPNACGTPGCCARHPRPSCSSGCVSSTKGWRRNGEHARNQHRQPGEPEPNIILTLTLTQADELWDALGERPHREDWSREIRTNLWDRLKEIRA